LNTDHDFFVLARVIDDSDPCWTENINFVGTRAQISKMVDLSAGVPYGWRLLRGKQAKRHLKWAAKEEALWRREQEMKRKSGGLN
jgi:hypothetical protein